MRNLLREPLTLFLLLGLGLFAADRVINGAPATRTDDARVVVTDLQQQALRTAFREEHGRDARPDELQVRINRWIDEEVLYREALALQLDRKDVIVRRQLTQKMSFLLQDAAELPTPSDADLQAWLDQNPQRYGQSATLSLQQVFLSRAQRGRELNEQAATIGLRLASNPNAYAQMGDPLSTGSELTRADPTQLRREFGLGFAQAVQQLKTGVWSGPVPSSLGLHWVRVTERHDFAPAKLENVREAVLTDHRVAQQETQLRRGLDRLRRKYGVEVEGIAP